MFEIVKFDNKYLIDLIILNKFLFKMKYSTKNYYSRGIIIKIKLYYIKDIIIK